MPGESNRRVYKTCSSSVLLILVDLMVCMISCSESGFIAHSLRPALMVGWRRISLVGISPSGACSDSMAKDGMVDGLRSSQFSIAYTLTKSLKESQWSIPRSAASTLSCSLKE